MTDQTNDQTAAASTAGAAVDAGSADTPLLAVLRGFESEGYTGQFDAREGGVIHCFSCGQDFDAVRCHDGPIRRLEGASDPADMLAVIPVRCPNCSTLGTLVTNYGPEATVADAEVLVALERESRERRADG
ncbi:MAG: hypothetical protein ACXIVQ_11670 [Acidimicrobiales bacterium]